MKQQEFNWKLFITINIATILAAYIVTLVIFGIIWDPNGAILLERPWQNALKIIWIGFYSSLPMGIDLFLVNHPISMVMGLGFLSFIIIGWNGRKNATGRQIIYALICLLTVLGTVKFFLMV